MLLVRVALVMVIVEGRDPVHPKMVKAVMLVMLLILDMAASFTKAARVETSARQLLGRGLLPLPVMLAVLVRLHNIRGKLPAEAAVVRDYF